MEKSKEKSIRGLRHSIAGPSHAVLSSDSSDSSETKRLHTSKVIKKASQVKRPSTVIVRKRSSRESASSGTDSHPIIPPRRPAFKLCYICGREFGSLSLAIHEPQCLRKWHNENNKLPRHLKRQPPRKPQPLGTAVSNNLHSLQKAALQNGQPQQLPCEYCGQTFWPVDLAIHQRTCKQSPPTKKDMFVEFMFLPRTAICYICGQKFVSQDLPAHEAECLEKWKAENDRLPEELRQMPPQKPQQFPNNLDKPEKKASSNDRPKDEPIVCSLCHKPVKADRFQVHQKFCKGQVSGTGTYESGAKMAEAVKIHPQTSKAGSSPPDKTGPTEQEMFVEFMFLPRTINCYICNQKIFVEAFLAHEVQCLQKWKEENDQLPEEQRQTPPQRPEHFASELALSRKKPSPNPEDDLVVCFRCHNTVNRNDFNEHQKTCQFQGSESANAESSPPNETGPTEQEMFVEFMFLPRMITCYICNQKIVVEAFLAHEVRCLEKWNEENDQLPEEQRQTPPQRPEHFTSELALWRKKPSPNPEDDLVVCFRCHNTINRYDFNEHQKACQFQSSESANAESSPPNETGPTEQEMFVEFMFLPRTINCYICNQKIFVEAFLDHEVQCLEKWKEENDQLPEEQRQTPPQRPEHFASELALSRKKPSPNPEDDLVVCSRCHNTVNRYDFYEHQKTCQFQGSESANAESSPPNETGPTEQEMFVEFMFLPRTINCYICDQKIVVEAFLAHEVQCLEKWNEENDQLPEEQRQTPPQRPEHFASELALSRKKPSPNPEDDLVVCSRCHNTVNRYDFYEHQKTCQFQGSESANAESSPPNEAGATEKETFVEFIFLPRTINCYICDQKIVVEAFLAHEVQCLEKWKEENDQLPEEQRQTPPQRPEHFASELALSRKKPSPNPEDDLVVCFRCHNTVNRYDFHEHQKTCQFQGSESVNAESSPPNENGPRKKENIVEFMSLPKMISCYICGQKIVAQVFPAHEAECLEKWKVENDQLPEEQRQTPPQRPEHFASELGLSEEKPSPNPEEELVVCSRCHQSIHPDNFHEHQKTCQVQASETVKVRFSSPTR
uniref:C2HC/C3H-type domain-containing protein n=1 Tax=Monodelphis domestica TaxID=13616 RepID=A0A5F8GZ23_MONDO